MSGAERRLRPVAVDRTIDLGALREVACDVMDMKLMAIPIVADLASCARPCGWGQALTAALEAQLRDERRHLALCEALSTRPRSLDAHGAGAASRHVRSFARAVEKYAVGAARPHLLCVATALCTAVEAAAFRQLGSAAPEGPWKTLFQGLARDEAAHFRLVTGPVVDRLLMSPVARDAWRAHRLTAVLAGIALGSWWPARVASYRDAGLNVGAFVRSLSQDLAPALRRLGVFFPRRLFETGARAWLSICLCLAGCAWRAAPGGAVGGASATKEGQHE